MKKITLFFMMFSSIIFAENNIKKLDEKVNSTYITKENKLEKDRLKSNLMDFNKINVSTGIDYSKTAAGHGLVQSNNINYAFINYNLSFDLFNKNIASHSINASKTINEYFYNRIGENEIDYQISKFKLESEKEKELFDKLELLKKYNLQKIIVELNEKEKVKFDQDRKNIEKSYQIGAISKYDYDVAKSNLELSELRFSLDKDTLEQIKINLLSNDIELMNLDLNFDGKRLDDKILMEYVKRKYIVMEELEIAKTEYNQTKDFMMNKLPLITPAVGYDIKNNAFTAGVTVAKSFDIVTSEYDEMEELKQEIQKKKDNLKLLEQKMFLEEKNAYNAILFKFILNRTKVKNLENELKIVERKFELGSEKYITLLEKRNELLRSKIDLEESMLDVSLYNLKLKRGVK